MSSHTCCNSFVNIEHGNANWGRMRKNREILTRLGTGQKCQIAETWLFWDLEGAILVNEAPLAPYKWLQKSYNWFRNFLHKKNKVNRRDLHRILTREPKKPQDEYAHRFQQPRIPKIPKFKTLDIFDLCQPLLDFCAVSLIKYALFAFHIQIEMRSQETHYQCGYRIRVCLRASCCGLLQK